jgi:hypothetical protein
MTAVPRNEDPAGVVDPDLLDLRVVEVTLNGAEAGHPRHQLVDQCLDVLDGRHRAGEAASVMGLGDPLTHATHGVGLVLRVDACIADERTHLVHELGDQTASEVTPEKRGAGGWTECSGWRRRDGHGQTVASQPPSDQRSPQMWTKCSKGAVSYRVLRLSRFVSMVPSRSLLRGRGGAANA